MYNLGFSVSSAVIIFIIFIVSNPGLEIGEKVLKLAGIAADFLWRNKITLSFLTVAIVFVVYVGKVSHSLAEIANSMSNWDVALEEE